MLVNYIGQTLGIILDNLGCITLFASLKGTSKLDLIEYLSNNFYTKEELLNLTKISEQVLIKYQQSGLMPKASYTLELDIGSDSFFGSHTEKHKKEYYAKGYVSWLGFIHTARNKDNVYREFSSRYINALDELRVEGHSSSNSKLTTGVANHIEEEWGHFINGIYGLCTKTGLPEDIAAKEFAVLEINELLELERLTDKQIEQLTLAVNLLDSASSMFAPHERLQSSRHRLVDEVRRKYKLPS